MSVAEETGRVVRLAVKSPSAFRTIAEVAGELDLPPHVLRFDIHALTATRALRFDGRRLRELCARDHELGHLLSERISQVLVRRLEAMSMQLMDLYGVQEGEHE